MIPRDAFGWSCGDASTGDSTAIDGLGYYCFNHGFGGLMMLSDDIRRRLHLHDRSADRISINQLEMATVLF